MPSFEHCRCRIGLVARYAALLVLISFCSVAVRAQMPGAGKPSSAGTFPNGPQADSGRSKVRQLRPGFDLPDSLYVARDSVRGDIDTIVRYTAKDSTVFDVARKRMTLTNNATVQFQNRELDAYTIVFDFEQNTLTAHSYDYDSVVNASLAVRRRIIRDTNRVKSRGAPILHEGTTPYEGEVIVYNFKTKRGTVQLGTTEMEGGFYYGEKIKQVAPQTLFVENGRFTTCDAPVPHYYFESPRMKVIMQDKVFAEPVYLYVADVPIFALPFGVFPNHSGGRRSGVIMPSYQVTGTRGYGLTHLGYYQIFSDYFDAAIRSDIYTKGGWNVDLNTAWMQRYLLSSPASLHLGYGFSRQNSVDPFAKNWLIQGALPNLTLGYNSQLSANVSFSSSNYFQNNPHNINDVLTQLLNSNASYTTSWEDLGLSMGLDYNRSQNLIENTYDEDSPSLSLRENTIYPFNNTENSATLDPTLASLGIGYTMSAKRHLSRARTAGGSLTDTSTYFSTERYGVLHNPSIGISPRLGHFSITPTFNYQEAWLFRRHIRSYYLGTDSLSHYRDSVVNGFNRLYSWNAGVGVSTTLYGIANIGALGITAVRHALTPSINFSYHPNTAPQEVVEYHDPRSPATVQTYDMFDGEIYSGIASGKKSATLSLGLGNDFEAKVMHEYSADSSSEEKVKLLSLSASTGYDLIQKLLSQFALSAHTTIGTRLNVHADAAFSFYPRTVGGYDSTAATLLSLGQGILRPLTASIGLDGNFASSETSDGMNYDSLRRLVNVTSPEDERTMLLGGYYPGPYINIPFRPKWSVSYGLSYQQTYVAVSPTRDSLARSFSINSQFTFSPTQGWSITSSAGYDLVGKRIVVPDIRVHRDLHCWEMNFSYNPPGSLVSGFNFEIRIKAPQLQDVKLTRTERSFGEF